MRVVAFLIPELGHINPILPTLRHLGARGHDVVVASAADLGAACAATAPRARAEVLPFPPRAARVTRGRAFADALRDPAWLAAWVEGLLLDDVNADVPVIEEALARLRPDVVVADPMLYAVAIACARTKTPWAGVSTSLNPVTPPSWRTALTDTLARLSPRRAALFTDHGVPVPRFRVSDASSEFLDVVFTADAYARVAADVAAVGAPFDEFDVEARDADVEFNVGALAPRRRLYCSFGSQAFHQPRLLRRIFSAAEALSLQVVASIGDLVDDAAFVAAAPADAVLVRRLPQLKVLQHVDVMVSHGGANSVVEALTIGVPLLLLPLCNDQPLQARFLVDAGVGAAVDVVDVDSEHDVDEGALAAALSALLTPAAKARFAPVSTALRTAGGPARAAALVEQLGVTRLPVRP